MKRWGLGLVMVAPLPLLSAWAPLSPAPSQSLRRLVVTYKRRRAAQGYEVSSRRSIGEKIRSPVFSFCSSSLPSEAKQLIGVVGRRAARLPHIPSSLRASPPSAVGTPWFITPFRFAAEPLAQRRPQTEEDWYGEVTGGDAAEYDPFSQVLGPDESGSMVEALDALDSQLGAMVREVGGDTWRSPPNAADDRDRPQRDQPWKYGPVEMDFEGDLDDDEDMGADIDDDGSAVKKRDDGDGDGSLGHVNLATASRKRFGGSMDDGVGDQGEIGPGRRDDRSSEWRSSAGTAGLFAGVGRDEERAQDFDDDDNFGDGVDYRGLRKNPALREIDTAHKYL